MNAHILPTLLSGLTLLVNSAPLVGQDTDTKPAAQDQAKVEQNELEQKFEKLMTGCKMTGKFTMRNPKKPAQEDTYTIAKVEKVKGSKWRFHAKIEYGTKSVTVPLVVDVKWAGDTPVIQVTKMAIPFLGTYSARVLVYDGGYTGTWSGIGYGGQMYGKIVQAGEAEKDKEKDAQGDGEKKKGKGKN